MIIFFKELSCINHFHIFSYILCYNVFFYNTFQCNFVLMCNGLSRCQYEIKLNNLYCMWLKTSSFTLESLIKKKFYPMITLINYHSYSVRQYMRVRVCECVCVRVRVCVCVCVCSHYTDASWV